MQPDTIDELYEIRWQGMIDALAKPLAYVGVVFVGSMLNLKKAIDASNAENKRMTALNIFFQVLGSAFSGTMFALAASHFSVTYTVSLAIAGVGGWLGISSLERVASFGMNYLENMSKKDKHDAGEDRHRRPRRQQRYEEYQQPDHEIPPDDDFYNEN